MVYMCRKGWAPLLNDHARAVSISKWYEGHGPANEHRSLWEKKSKTGDEEHEVSDTANIYSGTDK